MTKKNYLDVISYYCYSQDMVKQKEETIKNILLDIRRMLCWFFSGEGAIITLTLLVIAAVLGFLIQDAIQKQRYLELLELETRMNLVTVNNEINSYNKGHGILYPPFPQFKTDVYSAGLQSGYLLTLDPSIQAQIVTNYSQYLPLENKLIADNEGVINRFSDGWQDCLVNSTIQTQIATVCNQQKQLLDNAQTLYSPQVLKAYEAVGNVLMTLKFNPTEERLHPTTLEGFILRLLMGDKSLKIQQ